MDPFIYDKDQIIERGPVYDIRFSAYPGDSTERGKPFPKNNFRTKKGLIIAEGESLGGLPPLDYAVKC